MIAPLLISCRECAAQVNEPCVGLLNGCLHADRIEDAAGWVDLDAREPSQQEMDAVIERMAIL